MYIDANRSSDHFGSNLNGATPEPIEEIRKKGIPDPPSNTFFSQDTLVASSFSTQITNDGVAQSQYDSGLSFGGSFDDPVPLGHLVDTVQLTDTPSTLTQASPLFCTTPLPRLDHESDRDYTSRCALEGFGIQSLRAQQWEVLESLIFKGDNPADCDDVVLITKTSFGKSLLFQLAPLIIGIGPGKGGRRTKSSIILVLMPLNILLAEQCSFTQGRLGANCCVATEMTATEPLLSRIARGDFNHSKLPLPFCTYAVFRTRKSTPYCLAAVSTYLCCSH